MKKQVIVYVDVPDTIGDIDVVETDLMEMLEEMVGDALPDTIYLSTEDRDDIECELDWGGVTARDAS